MDNNINDNYFNKPIIPDHDFLFTYTMFTIALSNRLVSDAAANWFDKGQNGMHPKLRSEAIDFMQDIIKRAFILHCDQSLGKHNPGME